MIFSIKVHHLGGGSCIMDYELSHYLDPSHAKIKRTGMASGDKLGEVPIIANGLKC